MEIIINLSIAILFLIFGYLIKYKKKYNLIVGFNDYNKNNDLSDKYNMTKIGNTVGNSLFYML